MKCPETRWLYRTTDNFHELREASCNTCIIPMGSIEKHGLHLPLGTDMFAASQVAYEASKLETCCVFPDFVFGNIPYNSPNAPAGTYTTRMETFMNLLEETCWQISRHGYNKILVVNGHGGNNTWLDSFIEHLQYKKRNFVFLHTEVGLPLPHKIAEAIQEKGAEAFPELTPEDVEYILKCHEENMLIGHAGLSEAAFMMALTPENVHLDRLGIEDGHPTHDYDKYENSGLRLGNYGWALNFPNTYCGDDPVGVNERMGRAALRFEAENVARMVKLLKEDTFLLEQLAQYQQGWE